MLLGAKQHLLTYKEKSFYVHDAVYVDSTYFDMFDYHFVNGAPSSKILANPYTIVLLKPIADNLFGSEDPLGKVITIDNAYGKHDFKVTGVVDESLGRTQIHANVFITMNSGGMGQYVRSNTMWAGNNFTNSFIKLRHDANVEALEKKLPAFLNKYGADQMKQMGMSKSCICSR